MKGIPQSNSATNIKEKKSLGKKLKDWFKKPFTKASTATEIPLDQRTDISGSQNFEKVKAPAEFNPYQHPAHGQIFIPGSIAVIKNGNETVAYVPGNIAVAVNRPGLNMDAVPMLLAANTVVPEIDQVMEETPKLEGELSPKFEVMSPHYNPVDVAGQLDDVEHMNEKDAEMYRSMRESRMLYASSTQRPVVMNDPKFYLAQVRKSTVKLNDGRDSSLRESRTYA